MRNLHGLSAKLLGASRVDKAWLLLELLLHLLQLVDVILKLQVCDVRIDALYTLVYILKVRHALEALLRLRWHRVKVFILHLLVQ